MIINIRDAGITDKSNLTDIGLKPDMQFTNVDYLDLKDLVIRIISQGLSIEVINKIKVIDLYLWDVNARS